MTTQATPLARVNTMLFSLMSCLNGMAKAFFMGFVSMTMALVFLCAIAAFVIPLTHYAVNYWSGFASSLQQSPYNSLQKAAKK